MQATQPRTRGLRRNKAVNVTGKPHQRHRHNIGWAPDAIMFRESPRPGYLPSDAFAHSEGWVAADLDAIDWKILKELQDNGRITNVELARRVGISAPPSLRRVRALEEAGYIKGYRALLDEKRLGYEVTVFAMVHLSSQAEADLAAFEAFVRKA